MRLSSRWYLWNRPSHHKLSGAQKLGWFTFFLFLLNR